VLAPSNSQRLSNVKMDSLAAVVPIHLGAIEAKPEQFASKSLLLVPNFWCSGWFGSGS
jgi:hypothetical protein